MTLHLALVLGLLCAAVAMFAINKPRMDAVAVLMMTLLPFTGVITIQEALRGFSDSNVILIGALFVIGEGLVRTGVAQRLGDWLMTKAGSSPIRLVVLLMFAVSGLGSVMSSTGVVAIFIPIVLRIAQNTGTAPSQLMMPLSVAALISGMLTLVATAPNLVVNSELVRSGAEGFGFFSFTPFGLPVLLLGVAYMTMARRLLAARRAGGGAAASQPSLSDWIDRYGLAEREHRVRVMDESPLIGRTIEELRMDDTTGATILAIERPGRKAEDLIAPTERTALLPGDILFVDMLGAPPTDAAAIRQRLALEELPLSGSYFLDRSQDIGMAELVLPAGSGLIGETLTGSRFRATYGLTVVALRRGRGTLAGDYRNEALKPGDTLLAVGPWPNIRRLQSDRSDMLILNLPAEFNAILPAASRAPQALACLLLVVGLMVSGVVPNVHAALIGCLLMGALGCVDMTSAYRSISWQSLILIVGMLPFSTALERTGGVDLAADGLLSVTSGAGIHGVLACLFAVTAVLGLFISNTATAVLMAPVALAIAHDLHVSPYPFAMIVALAASAAFMTPVSSPVNTLVVGPGNYGFGDFLKVGVPFTIIVMAVSVFLVPLLLRP